MHMCVLCYYYCALLFMFTRLMLLMVLIANLIIKMFKIDGSVSVEMLTAENCALLMLLYAVLLCVLYSL